DFSGGLCHLRAGSGAGASISFDLFVPFRAPIFVFARLRHLPFPCAHVVPEAAPGGPKGRFPVKRAWDLEIAYGDLVFWKRRRLLSLGSAKKCRPRSPRPATARRPLFNPQPFRSPSPDATCSALRRPAPARPPRSYCR